VNTLFISPLDWLHPSPRSTLPRLRIRRVAKMKFNVPWLVLQIFVGVLETRDLLRLSCHHSRKSQIIR
jgi:hypothetical protein